MARPADYPLCSICQTRQADGYGSPGLGLPVRYRCNPCMREEVANVPKQQAEKPQGGWKFLKMPFITPVLCVDCQREIRFGEPAIEVTPGAMVKPTYRCVDCQINQEEHEAAVAREGS